MQNQVRSGGDAKQSGCVLCSEEGRKTITARQLKLGLGQIANPVRVVTQRNGEYVTLGMWIPAQTGGIDGA